MINIPEVSKDLEHKSSLCLWNLLSVPRIRYWFTVIVLKHNVPKFMVWDIFYKDPFYVKFSYELYKNKKWRSGICFNYDSQVIFW